MPDTGATGAEAEEGGVEIKGLGLIFPLWIAAIICAGATLVPLRYEPLTTKPPLLNP